jgi:hypothetical protein
VEALDSFKLLGKVSHITVDIDPMELGTL